MKRLFGHSLRGSTRTGLVWLATAVSLGAVIFANVAEAAASESVSRTADSLDSLVPASSKAPVGWVEGDWLLYQLKIRAYNCGPETKGFVSTDAGSLHKTFNKLVWAGPIPSPIKALITKARKTRRIILQKNDAAITLCEFQQSIVDADRLVHGKVIAATIDDGLMPYVFLDSRYFTYYETLDLHERWDEWAKAHHHKSGYFQVINTKYDYESDFEWFAHR